jgi:copper homeostasis protein
VSPAVFGRIMKHPTDVAGQTFNSSSGKRHIQLELCAASVEDACCAQAMGVDRLELNSAIPLGGLTPTTALLESVKSVFTGPVIAMIRPREGGFQYSDSELRLMRREAELLVEHGADGIAVGFLLNDSQIDVAECQRFRSLFPDIELVFHRALDFCRDLPNSARLLVDCGFQRILTSGGQVSASRGIASICKIHEVVAGQIEILPGGGIRANNVAELIRETGVTQVHSAARGSVSDPPSAASPFAQDTGTDWFSRGRTCEATLQSLIRELRQIESTSP